MPSPHPLTQEEFLLIQDWKEHGVLRPIDEHRIRPEIGAVQVICSDPYRFPEAHRHHRRKYRRVPPIALFGAPVRIAEDSPIVGRGRADLVIIDDIRMALVELGIPYVCLQPHTGCLACHLKNIGLKRVPHYIFGGKLRIRREIPGSEPSGHLHVDYRPFIRKMRSYYLSRPDWEEWEYKQSQKASIPARH